MSIIFMPLRPDVLPLETHHVTVGGTTLPVSVTAEDGGYLATHADTGCWGYGDSVERALDDLVLMLANDREWYCFGAGKTLYMWGRSFERRAAVQKTFGVTA